MTTKNIPTTIVPDAPSQGLLPRDDSAHDEPPPISDKPETLRDEFQRLTCALKHRPRGPSIRSLFDWCSAMTTRLIDTDATGAHHLSPVGQQILGDLLLLFAENTSFMHPSLLGWIEANVLPCIGASPDTVHADLAYQLMRLLIQRAQSGGGGARTRSAVGVGPTGKRPRHKKSQ